MLISPDRPGSRAARLPSAWQPSPDLTDLASAFRLLGDPRRLALLHLLTSRERCVCEFEELLGWPQNLISHHLGILRRAGLVAARRDAQWVYYSLVPDRFERVRRLIAELLGTGDLPPTARFGAAPRRCGAEGASLGAPR